MNVSCQSDLCGKEKGKLKKKKRAATENVNMSLLMQGSERIKQSQKFKKVFRSVLNCREKYKKTVCIV